MPATITTMTVTSPGQGRLTQAFVAGTVEENAGLELVFGEAGLGCQRYQTVSPRVDFPIPDGCSSVAVCQETREANGVVTRNYGVLAIKANAYAALTAGQYAQLKQGVIYDHSQIDHGPDGPVTGGDPNIASLSPNTVATSAGAATVTVTGTKFVAGSVVEVDGVAQSTTYVSATSLTISFDPTVAKTYLFSVRNPNEEESNSVPFIATAAAADPTDAPTNSNTKTEIVKWLRKNGVTFSKDVLMALTKAELLEIVAAIIDGADPDEAAEEQVGE